MATETGKQRSQRIDINYYRQRTGLHRFRTACVALGLLGAVAYAAYVVFAGGSHLSTGPVASAHAAFENDCQECHRNLTPMDSRGSKINLGLLGVSATETAQHIESACTKCHQVGDHYRDTMSDDWKLADQNCSGCHADHQGRDHDLTLVASQRCVACHRDLAAGCSNPSDPAIRSSVTGFDEPLHGDFASLLGDDPGTVKFDHAQHMMPGQVDANSKGGFTIEQLHTQDRERYRGDGQSDSDLVQLDCASCHEMAGTPNDGLTLIADAELGRYIKPISFEQHCAACHSLNPGIATVDSTPLPHAVTWNQVDLLLRANAKGAQASGLARQARDDSQTVALPGEGLGSRASATSPETVFDLDAARSLVKQKCLQCHEESDVETDEAIARAAQPGNELIPSRWLKHGLYDHAAHRKVDCRYCHQQAYGDGSESGPPQDHQIVMIAGIDSCTSCHRSEELATPVTAFDQNAKELLDGQPTWASDQCILCHRYHTPHGGSDALSLTGLQSTSASKEATP